MVRSRCALVGQIQVRRGKYQSSARLIENHRKAFALRDRLHQWIHFADDQIDFIALPRFHVALKLLNLGIEIEHFFLELGGLLAASGLGHRRGLFVELVLFLFQGILILFDLLLRVLAEGPQPCLGRAPLFDFDQRALQVHEPELLLGVRAKGDETS